MKIGRVHLVPKVILRGGEPNFTNKSIVCTPLVFNIILVAEESKNDIGR